MTKAPNYFTAAKKAAAKEILDPSKAHRLAIETIKTMVKSKAESFYAEMAWQCVLAVQCDRARKYKTP